MNVKIFLHPTVLSHLIGLKGSYTNALYWLWIYYLAAALWYEIQPAIIC